MASREFDFVVVGAGMAGASVAWELSTSATVLLLEQEDQPGYHATGRSAAAFIPSYGHQNSALHALTHASRGFLETPPKGFSDVALLRRRGLLTIAPRTQSKDLAAERDALASIVPNQQWLQRDAMLAMVPALRADYTGAGLFEPDVFDIDVDALHQGYLRGFRERGGTLSCGMKVAGIRRRGGRFMVSTSVGEVAAPVLVNASGAWADQVAELAGVAAVGLQPMRRTAVLIDPPQGMSVAQWPLLLAQDESFYAKPDAGALLVSPADEHPSVPLDAQPEELDIAYAVHNVQQALQLETPRVRHAWAGLRSFVDDRTPVIGRALDQKGFYWICGQGGHGIQTAPAVAGLAAAQLLDQPLPPRLKQRAFNADWVTPERFPVADAS